MIIVDVGIKIVVLEINNCANSAKDCQVLAGIGRYWQVLAGIASYLFAVIVNYSQLSPVIDSYWKILAGIGSY